MNYYNEIKEQLINNELTKRIKDYSKNRGDLNTYYSVGKLLFEAGKHYGEGIIKEYSKKLTKELNKTYSQTSLKYFRLFYNFAKRHSLSDELSYTHYKTLLSIKDNNKIAYYIEISAKHKLSVRELKTKIINNEYERLPQDTKEKITNKSESKVEDLIKNPIIINNRNNYVTISEKVLQKIIMEDINHFLEELGSNFCYVKNEYKIKIGNSYNYIDLLLYNIDFNCYVVIELKVTELKKEHVGQIQVYMNYIDNNLKLINQNRTIGIIICKKENKYIIEYCSDKRIIAKEFKIIQ
ncbi:MAG: DUF1016 family protein [Bacilli bacterium]|nr:DUF1016 family protein [Bacilli bacterium]